MKQVVRNQHSNTVLLIGSGRLARHLQYWNSLLQTPNHLLTWDRSQDPLSIEKYLNDCHVVWLAISDSAVISFFEKYLAGTDVPVIHFSGALNDARLISAHPMMSFPTEMLPDSIYQNIFFALTGAQSLTDVLPGFQNPTFQVSAEDKPLYHALCVVAGNFPQLLWTEVNISRQKLNIPESALHIYLKQILNNFLVLKEKSITGPIARKDHPTLQKNMQALSGTKLHSIYSAFVKEFVL